MALCPVTLLQTRGLSPQCLAELLPGWLAVRERGLGRIGELLPRFTEASARCSLGFSGCSDHKNLPAMQETQVQFLGQEDPLEKGMATHSSLLAWRISWAEEPGGLQSMGSQRVRYDGVSNTPEGASLTVTRRECGLASAPPSSFSREEFCEISQFSNFGHELVSCKDLHRPSNRVLENRCNPFSHRYQPAAGTQPQYPGF